MLPERMQEVENWRGPSETLQPPALLDVTVSSLLFSLPVISLPAGFLPSSTASDLVPPPPSQPSAALSPNPSGYYFSTFPSVGNHAGA